MVRALEVILDDRDDPAQSVSTAIGMVRYGDILRRRQTMASELIKTCKIAGIETVHLLKTPKDSAKLTDKIRDRGDSTLYVRLPLWLPPLQLSGLEVLLKKARYALETMLASQIKQDDAVAVLKYKEAMAVLQAPDAETRLDVLQAIRETVPTIMDHAAFIDIRHSGNLMLYLSGATEMRHFNMAHRTDGLFFKQSQDVAKMRAEHGFFQAVPLALKRFLLPSFDFWEKDGAAGYCMELMAVPDAALQWVHQAFDATEFEAFVGSVFEFVDARPVEKPDPDTAQSQILGKLDTRLATFLASPVGQKLDQLLATSGPYGDLRSMSAKARPFIEAALKRTAKSGLAVSHGDLCFSNILYDRRLRLMRLIDPRGAIQMEDALMHPLYDVAKFSHSVLGGYDFVNNGLFSTRLDPDLNLVLDWANETGPPAWAGAAFRKTLADKGIDVRDVRAIEMSLFLSMLPLHQDHPDKVLGFVLIAASILAELDAA